jgi:hypothetical protein
MMQLGAVLGGVALLGARRVLRSETSLPESV